MNAENDCIVVVLSSGHSLRLRKVMLFPEDAVKEIAELRAHAAKGLGASGTGVGVIGTPGLGFALEAGAMLAVSGLLANAVQKTALDYLRKAEAQHATLWQEGVYFEADGLKGTHIPRPGAWWVEHGTRQETVDISYKSRPQIDEFLAAHNRTRSDVHRGAVKIDAPGHHVYNGDEFVRAATDVGEMLVRWTDVVAYFPPQPRLGVVTT